jgi:regulatory protein
MICYLLKKFEEGFFMDEKAKAKRYALRLLTARSYSSHQLRAKMLAKGYSEEIIAEWIEWLKSVELLHDDLVLESAIQRELRKGYGPKAIIWKLRQKHFPHEEIVQTLARIASPEVQKETMRAWASRKNDRRKAASDLIRRGFDSSLVFDALRESL